MGKIMCRIRIQRTEHRLRKFPGTGIDGMPGILSLVNVDILFEYWGGTVH